MNILRVRSKQQLCSSFLQTAGLQVPTDPGAQLPPTISVVQAEPPEHSWPEQRKKFS